MSQLDQYLAYLDSHSEDDVKVVSFKEWKAAQPFIRHCSCGGTIVTSTDRCNQCSAPSTELQEGMAVSVQFWGRNIDCVLGEFDVESGEWWISIPNGACNFTRVPTSNIFNRRA